MKTPILETERLILRPVSLEDAPAIQKYFGNWDIIRNMAVTVPWPYPPDGAIQYLGRILPKMSTGDMCEWAINLKETPVEMIGAIAISKRDDGNLRRDFWLAEPFHGNGYMTEAVTAVHDYIFFELKAPLIIVNNAVNNKGSRRVKEKTGAIFLKTEELHYHNGDTVGEVWEITKENWQKIRQKDLSEPSLP